MKNIIISIIIALLLASGLWYFTNAENQSKITLQKAENNITNNYQAGATTIEATSTLDQHIINKDSKEKITMNAILHTNFGDITIKLNSEVAPKTVENFVKLAKSGFYDGTKFHRIIKNFMNQGGDPLSKDDSAKARWGTGGPGYQFADEITQSNSNDVGSLAMANSGPNTNGSQFFINVADNSFLNTKHTVFGNVTDGMDIVTAINSTKTVTNDIPEKAVIIKSITIK